MDQLIQKYNELNESLKDVQQKAKSITSKMNEVKDEMEIYLTSHNMKSFKFNDLKVNVSKKIVINEEKPKKEKQVKPIVVLSANEQYQQQMKKKK